MQRCARFISDDALNYFDLEDCFPHHSSKMRRCGRLISYYALTYISLVKGCQNNRSNRQRFARFLSYIDAFTHNLYSMERCARLTYHGCIFPTTGCSMQRYIHALKILCSFVIPSCNPRYGETPGRHPSLSSMMMRSMEVWRRSWLRRSTP